MSTARVEVMLPVDLPTAHAPGPGDGAALPHMDPGLLAAVGAAEGVLPAAVLGTLLALVTRRYDRGEWQLSDDRGNVWCGDTLDLTAGLGQQPIRQTGMLRSPGAAHSVTLRVPADAPADQRDSDLVCELGPVPRWTTPSSTLGHALVTRMMAHVTVLLEDLRAHPGTTLGGLDMLDGGERALLDRHRGTVVTYPETTLHGLVEAQSHRAPDAPALVHGDDVLTYAALCADAAEVVAALRSAGVVPRDVVGLCGPRSLPLFSALLGILNAGAAVCYLDDTYPEAYLAYMVDIARPAAFVVAPGGATPAPGSGPQVPVVQVPVVVAPPERAFEPAAPPPSAPVGAEDPAYLLFTSGTTGRPKGVVRPHRMHTSRIALEQSLYAMGPQHRHLLKSPISFRELFWPLASGGTCVVVDPGGEKDDAHLLALIRRHGVTVVSFVPSMLRVLMAHQDAAALAQLEHVFVGGEALDPELEAQLRALGPGVHVTYTLTEADYVIHRPGPVEGFVDGASVIGRPLDMAIRLLDADGQEVPPGLFGEIVAGGPGLATGYLGDAEATAEKFVVDPRDGTRMFRTGDLARFRADGQLEYGGRRDLQVKVRGQRVEPTEVESALRAHPGIRAAAVVGYSDPAQGARLVGFVEPADRGAAGAPPPTPAELRDFLRGQLPEHAIPAHLVLVPRLPLLLSGKVDRQALRVPERTRAASRSRYAPPTTPTERRVLELWCRVLSLAEVGIDDGFVDLGGDSLRVLVLRSFMEAEFATEVAVSALLGCPTVRAQARLLDGPPAPSAVLLRGRPHRDAEAAQARRTAAARSRR